MIHVPRWLKVGSVAIVSFLAFFPVGAFAASFLGAGADVAQATVDSSPMDFATPIYQAIAAHQISLALFLGLMLITVAAKRWLGDKFPSLKGDTGRISFMLAFSTFGAVAASLASPSAHLTLAMVRNGLGVGVTAAGGYAALEHLIVVPILKPFVAKAPVWMQPILNLVISLFDRTSPAIPAAEAAGSAAVAAKPAAGADGVVGAPLVVK